MDSSDLAEGGEGVIDVVHLGVDSSADGESGETGARKDLKILSSLIVVADAEVHIRPRRELDSDRKSP